VVRADWVSLCSNPSYGPERIDPGDRQRRLTTIIKVTSGSTPEAAAFVHALYRRITTAGTHKAPSLKVAEATACAR